ncbi:MAG: hypothetical protein GKR90_22960 [Pseudomonadales bacterium]|nr:hypothetical protein [Pseudomonadales bacterium]
MDNLNKWLSVLANFGVLVGIVFLAFEIQQNTTATQLETASNFQDGFAELELMIASDAEFAALLTKGRNGDDISESEFVRLQAFYSAVLRGWQTNIAQFESGGLNDEIWQGTKSLMRQRLREDKGLVEHVQVNRDQFSGALLRMTDAMLADISVTSN